MKRLANRSNSGPSSQHRREFRAARNQVVFRSLNERLAMFSVALDSSMHTFTMVCECPDITCVETFEIEPEEYRALRAEPRHFAVQTRHVHPHVERVVRRSDRFVVVEKMRAAAVAPANATHFVAGAAADADNHSIGR